MIVATIGQKTPKGIKVTDVTTSKDSKVKIVKIQTQEYSDEKTNDTER